MNNNILILKEFIRIYFVNTDSLYYSLSEYERQNFIKSEYMTVASEVSAIVIYVAGKLELTEFVNGEVYGHSSVKYLRLCELANKQMEETIKFIKLSNDKPFVEEEGHPNWALVTFRKIGIEVALDSAYRKINIDNILNNINNDQLSL